MTIGIPGTSKYIALLNTCHTVFASVSGTYTSNLQNAQKRWKNKRFNHDSLSWLKPYKTRCFWTSRQLSPRQTVARPEAPQGGAGGTVRHLNGVEWSAAEASGRMQCSMAPLWKCVKTIGKTSVSLRIPWRMRNEPAHASEVNCAGTLMSETCMRETSWSALGHPGHPAGIRAK